MVEGKLRKPSQILAGAIDTSVIPDDAITTAKIDDGAVTTAKLDTGAVDTDQLAADAVDGTKIADDSIDSEHIADGAIDNGHIANAAIQAGKLSVFQSSEITGNAGAQSTAHGLGRTPALVIVYVTNEPVGLGGVVEGTHTSTNVVVTAATGVKYKVVAL